jgi:hypothetical protein
MKRIIIFNLLIIISFAVYSQCPNLNFSNGDFSNWQCYAGSWTDSSVTINLSNPVAGRHSILNGAELLRTGKLYDEHCPKITKVPDGFAYSARIGNDQSGAEIDAIEYTLTVDSNNAIVIIHFAYVIQDSNHSENDRPRFTISVRDSAGNLLDIPCNSIMPYSATGMDLACSSGGIEAKDWTTFAFNLESVIGQTVYIYFETRDCTDGNHFGYAYVVAECYPMTLSSMYCHGQTVARFRAPGGFAKYIWTRSSKPGWMWSGMREEASTLALTDPIDNEIITCKIESTLHPECSITLHTVVRKTSIKARFWHRASENDEWEWPLRFKNWYDTCNRTATFIDVSSVTNGKQSSRLWKIPELNVTSRDSLFTFTFPDPGLEGKNSATYSVRLTIETENGCIVDTLAEDCITVFPSPRIEITGATQMCQGDTTTLKYNVIHSKFIDYEWSWHDTDSILQTSTEDSINITHPGTYHLTAMDTNGCLMNFTHLVTDLIPNLSIINLQHVDCYGNATGSFSHGEVTSGTPPYQYFAWTLFDENGQDSIDVNSNITGKIYTNLIAGYYAFEAIDDRGCILKGGVEITQPDSLTLFGTQDGLERGELQLIASGGILPYTFQLKKIDNSITVNSDFATNLIAGEYAIMVTDANGCTATDTILVTQGIIVSSLKENNSVKWSLGQNIPNPAFNSIRIPYSIPNDGTLEFTLHSLTGQLLHKEIISSLQGDNQLEYNTSGLSSGIYFYSLTYNNQRLTRKMVVKK